MAAAKAARELLPEMHGAAAAVAKGRVVGVLRVVLRVQSAVLRVDMGTSRSAMVALPGRRTAEQAIRSAAKGAARGHGQRGVEGGWMPTPTTAASITTAASASAEASAAPKTQLRDWTRAGSVVVLGL